MSPSPEQRSGAEVDESLDAAADDRNIARALRISGIVLLLGGAIALLAWLLRPTAAPPPPVQEAPLAPPQDTRRDDPAPPAVRFSDITASAGIDFVHHNGAYGERLLPETMGGGVALVDLDGDDLPELLFVNGKDWPWQAGATAVPGARLYRNLGAGSFRDVTAGSGLEAPLYGMGVAIGDVDGDGLRDLYLTAVGANRMLRNLGGNRFEDITAASGTAGADDGWSTSALFLDYDRDGLLDLFVLDYVRWSREIDAEIDYRMTGIGRAYGPPTNYAGTHARLYRNLGQGRFEDVSASAGIEVQHPATGLPMGKGLAATALDFDDDGWLDIMVANDTVQNFLFRNLGDGRFEEIGVLAGVAFDNAGAATGAMGVDAAHYANDADLAIAVGNFANEMTSFYVAQAGGDGGRGLFTDESIVSGIGPASRQALSFGLFFFDYDLDGRLDLLQTNGHIEDEINTVQPSQHYEQPSQLFWNCGRDCSRPLQPVPAETLGDLARPVVGRGAAFGDIDGDGDEDVVITQVGRAPLLLRNDQQLGHHWLRVALQGDPGNRDAIGARVSVRAGGSSQHRVQMPGRSYLSVVEPVLGFGLGPHAEVEQVLVQWPDGTRTELGPVPADQLLRVRKQATAD